MSGPNNYVKHGLTGTVVRRPGKGRAYSLEESALSFLDSDERRKSLAKKQRYSTIELFEHNPPTDLQFVTLLLSTFDF